MKHHITLALAGLLLTTPALPAPAADSAVTLPALPVRVLAGADPSAIESLVNVRIVKGHDQPVLQLDFAHKRVLDAMGLLVADISDRDPLALQGTVDKWRHVRALQALSATHPLDIHIDPDSLPAEQQTPPLPRIYNRGSVTYVVTHVPAPRQVTVFDLDATGNIDLLYIREQGGDATDTVAVDAVIMPLFGVEHIVAVSAVDPEHMHALNQWLYETHRAHGMVDTRGAILQQISALKDLRVGMVAEYTCESPSHCQR